MNAELITAMLKKHTNTIERLGVALSLHHVKNFAPEVEEQVRHRFIRAVETLRENTAALWAEDEV